MTTDTQHTSGTESNQIPFGSKLTTARETMKLDRKDAAAQLRLHEKYIDMMENENFPEDLPPIFIRGYIRAYGRLLQLSDDTIAEGLAPIKPRSSIPETNLKPPVKQMSDTSSRKYVMRAVTVVIAITMLWLVAAWWHGHSVTPIKTTETITTKIPATVTTTKPVKPAVTKPVPVKKAAPKPAAKKTAAIAPTQLNQARPGAASQQTVKTAAHNALPSPTGKKITVAAKKPSRPAYEEDEDDFYYVD